jgi:hypothetical protein
VSNWSEEQVQQIARGFKIYCTGDLSIFDQAPEGRDNVDLYLDLCEFSSLLGLLGMAAPTIGRPLELARTSRRRVGSRGSGRRDSGAGSNFFSNLIIGYEARVPGAAVGTLSSWLFHGFSLQPRNSGRVPPPMGRLYFIDYLLNLYSLFNGAPLSLLRPSVLHSSI